MLNISRSNSSYLKLLEAKEQVQEMPPLKDSNLGIKIKRNATILSRVKRKHNWESIRSEKVQQLLANSHLRCKIPKKNLLPKISFNYSLHKPAQPLRWMATKPQLETWWMYNRTVHKEKQKTKEAEEVISKLALKMSKTKQPVFCQHKVPKWREGQVRQPNASSIRLMDLIGRIASGHR